MGWVPHPGCDAFARNMGEHELVVGNPVFHTTCFTSNKGWCEETEPCNCLDRVGTGSEHFNTSPRRSRPPPPCSAAPIEPPPERFKRSRRSRHGTKERAAPYRVGKEKGKGEARLRSSSEFPCVSAEPGCRPTASRTGDARRPRRPEQASPCHTTPEAGTSPLFPVPNIRPETARRRGIMGDQWGPTPWIVGPSSRDGARVASARPELKRASLARIMR